MTHWTAAPILPLRDRAAVQDAWLRERLDTVVPLVMERAGIDAWVVAAREYNEDPVLTTMLPSEWFAARRRTILLFLERGRRRLAVTRYAVGDVFPPTWDVASEPDQWACVARLLDDADPATIGVNRSDVFALADGLSASEYDALVASLPAHLASRLVPADPLAIGWLETRIPAEREQYEEICAIAHQILRTGLSTTAITPGDTTTFDLQWWYLQQVADLGLASWFQPTVSIQREGGVPPRSFAAYPGDVTIEPGDLIHVDFGIAYLGLHTDMQEHAYVVPAGRSGPPRGLAAGMRVANRLQDLLTDEFVVGRTGNEVLASTRKAASAAGIDAAIYTHPIGLHGHAAGPTIGLWDQQDGVPGQGDYPLYPDTAYSIELSATVSVPEWHDQAVRFMLEQDAFFDGSSVEYLDGRQQELWLIG